MRVRGGRQNDASSSTLALCRASRQPLAMDVDGEEDEDVGMLPEEGQPRRVYGEIDGQAVQGAAAVQTTANMQSEHMELTLVRSPRMSSCGTRLLPGVR